MISEPVQEPNHTVFRQANDPDTPIKILAQLADSDDEVVLGAVAYNASTPLEVIDKLKRKNSTNVNDCLRKRGFL